MDEGAPDKEVPLGYKPPEETTGGEVKAPTHTEGGDFGRGGAGRIYPMTAEEWKEQRETFKAGKLKNENDKVNEEKKKEDTARLKVRHVVEGFRH